MQNNIDMNVSALSFIIECIVLVKINIHAMQISLFIVVLKCLFFYRFVLFWVFFSLVRQMFLANIALLLSVTLLVVQTDLSCGFKNKKNKCLFDREIISFLTWFFLRDVGADFSRSAQEWSDVKLTESRRNRIIETHLCTCFQIGDKLWQAVPHFR